MKHYLKHNILRSFSRTLLVGIICLTGGCRTTDQADSGDMASVTISGRTDAQIHEALANVFAANEYHQVTRLIFEKQGTGWDKLNYGGWSPNPVWIRMKINITAAEAGQCVLACDAYAVVDHNEASMEEEKKLSVAYRSECKKILDQVRAALDELPAGSLQ